MVIPMVHISWLWMVSLLVGTLQDSLLKPLRVSLATFFDTPFRRLRFLKPIVERFGNSYLLTCAGMMLLSVETN